MASKTKVELLRTGEFVLHCVHVEVFQTIDDGVRMQGHGTIKINQVGTVYMEFVSVSCENAPRNLFSESLPNDPLDEAQTMYLKARTIDGSIYESKEFSVNISRQSKNSPTLHYLFLSSITSHSKIEQQGPGGPQYLYFEFAENFKIPANKLNSDVSSSGAESLRWDETIIEMDRYSVAMVKKSTHIDVRVKGTFDIEEVRTCLRFYIGFSGASMPQIVFMSEVNGLDKTETICSVVNANKNQRSASPMVEHASNAEYRDGEYHYNVFKSITHLYRNYPKRFESLYSQWERVWHSFQSQNSITALVLSVAIEGLLNDIYIPEIIKTQDRSQLESEIEKVKARLKLLDLSKADLDRLMSSVSHWKNVTPSKALDHLISHGILTKEDKSLWTSLRNSSAHPKVTEGNLAKEKHEHEKVLSCLNLFHKLMLNTLSYSGPIALFRIGQEPELVELLHKKILH